jgi:hypothetical protein
LLIIVEGADGTYKSTLVRQLADVVTTATSPFGDSVTVRHCGPLPTDVHPLDAYVKPLLRHRPGTGQHVIYDRHYVGEWIYPGVFDRPSRADTATWRYVEMFLASRGALLVHADPPDEVIRANVARRGDDLVSPDDAVNAAQRFRSRIGQSQLPRLTYADINDPLLITSVIGRARELDDHAAVLNPFTTYVGPPRPRYLLLGDVRHALRNRVGCEHVGDSTRYGAAFGPYPGTSGHFLLEHLSPLLFPAGRPVLGIANACDVDDVAKLRRALGNPNVAALGRNAHRRLLNTITGPDDALFGAAPHPQWVRRFAHRHGWSYGVIVRGALERRANQLGWRPVDFARQVPPPTVTVEENAS